MADAAKSLVTCPHCGNKMELIAVPGSSVVCSKCQGKMRIAGGAPTAPRFLKCSCTHCAGHIEFPEAGLGAAIDCPHCGKSTVLSFDPPKAAPAPETVAKKGRGMLVAVVVALVAILGGGTVWFMKSRASKDSTGTTEKAPGTKAEAATPPPEEVPPASKGAREGDLQVVQYTLPKTKGSSIVYVIGSVTNHAKVQYFSLKVEFELFNTKGDKVGMASDQLANLAPHAAWNFRALVVDKQATSAKLAALKGDKE